MLISILFLTNLAMIGFWLIQKEANRKEKAENKLLESRINSLEDRIKANNREIRELEGKARAHNRPPQRGENRPETIKKSSPVSNNDYYERSNREDNSDVAIFTTLAVMDAFSDNSSSSSESYSSSSSSDSYSSSSSDSSSGGSCE